jgi:hypothetical protein
MYVACQIASFIFMCSAVRLQPVDCVQTRCGMEGCWPVWCTDRHFPGQTEQNREQPWVFLWLGRRLFWTRIITGANPPNCTSVSQHNFVRRNRCKRYRSCTGTVPLRRAILAWNATDGLFERMQASGAQTRHFPCFNCEHSVAWKSFNDILWSPFCSKA